MLLNEYLTELKKINLLNPDEEKLLWQGFKEQGDLDCRRKLIENYQPLVFKAAMQWQVKEPVVMDVIQEGTVGLIEAVEKYDYTRGVAFSLYAFHRIRGRIINFLEREGKLNWTSIDASYEDEQAATIGARLVDTKANISEAAEFNFLVEQVKTAMDRLPVKEQVVLNAVYLEDCEPKQLAQSLNISISHVYRLQKQGVRRVRGMLSKLMKEMKMFSLL